VEINVERLIGTKVRDNSGKVVGRIEEIRAERGADACLVESFMVGKSAVVQRLSAWTLVRPITKFLRTHDAYRVFQVDWKDMDLNDPLHPTLRIAGQDMKKAR
jgi:sporulation protein YlmC with PRC-barrel domain